MSWTKGTFLRCDNGCGMSVDYDNIETAGEARAVVRNWGWVFWNGEDFCNNCYVEALSQRQGPGLLRLMKENS